MIDVIVKRGEFVIYGVDTDIQGKNFINLLPNEIFFQIFSYLTVEELRHSSSVSLLWYVLACQSSVWLELIRSHFPYLIDKINKEQKKLSDSETTFEEKEINYQSLYLKEYHRYHLMRHDSGHFLYEISMPHILLAINGDLTKISTDSKTLEKLTALCAATNYDNKIIHPIPKLLNATLELAYLIGNTHAIRQLSTHIPNESLDLCIAAAKGDIKSVEDWVEKSVEILNNFYLQLALNYAIRNHHLDCVKYLLKKVPMRHSIEETLKEAAQYGHLDCIKYLLENYSLEDYIIKWGFSKAAQYGHLDCVKYFMEERESTIDPSSTLEGSLLWATRYGSLSCVKYILDKKSHAISPHYKGWALLEATRNRYLACVQYLLEKEGSAVSSHLGISLQEASRNGDLACVKYILSKKGYAISPFYKGCSLGDAAANGHLTCAKYLLENEGYAISNTHRKRAIKRSRSAVIIHAIQQAPKQTLMSYVKIALNLIWPSAKKAIPSIFYSLGRKCLDGTSFIYQKCKMAMAAVRAELLKFIPSSRNFKEPFSTQDHVLISSTVSTDIKDKQSELRVECIELKKLLLSQASFTVVMENSHTAAKEQSGEQNDLYRTRGRSLN